MKICNMETWSKDARVETEGQTKPGLVESGAASQHGHLCPGLTEQPFHRVRSQPLE